MKRKYCIPGILLSLGLSVQAAASSPMVYAAEDLKAASDEYTEEDVTGIMDLVSGLDDKNTFPGDLAAGRLQEITVNNAVFELPSYFDTEEPAENDETEIYLSCSENPGVYLIVQSGVYIDRLEMGTLLDGVRDEILKDDAAWYQSETIVSEGDLPTGYLTLTYCDGDNVVSIMYLGFVFDPDAGKYYTVRMGQEEDAGYDYSSDFEMIWKAIHLSGDENWKTLTGDDISEEGTQTTE